MEVGNIDLPINSNILIAFGKMNSTIRLSECYRPHPTLDVRLYIFKQQAQHNESFYNPFLDVLCSVCGNINLG